MKDSIQWAVSVKLKKDMPAGEEEKELLYIERGGRKEVRLLWKGGVLSFELMTDEMELPMILDTGSAGYMEELTVFWLGSRVELWTEQKLPLPSSMPALLSEH